MVRLVFTLMVLAALAMAATPLATITSQEAFSLNGASVPVAGVPRWPVAVGDEVVMARSSGLVVFKDGTKLFLIPNTKIKVEADGNRTVVRLLDGGLAYKLSEKTVVDLAALELDAVSRGSTEGRLWVENRSALWAPDNPAFYAAARNAQASTQREVSRRYRIGPFQLSFLNDWRQFNPPFGNPPGTPPSGPTTPSDPPPQPRDLVPISPIR